MEKIKLIGYWNGSTSSPEITFHVPVEDTDTRKLVVIEMIEIEHREQDNLKLSPKNLDTGLKRLARAVKNLEIKR